MIHILLNTTHAHIRGGQELVVCYIWTSFTEAADNRPLFRVKLSRLPFALLHYVLRKRFDSSMLAPQRARSRAMRLRSEILHLKS